MLRMGPAARGRAEYIYRSDADRPYSLIGGTG